MGAPDLPPTLRDLAGATFTAPDLATSVLILIDYQNEYLAGPLALRGAFDAVDQAVRLVWAVRDAGGRVIHVAHAGRPGGLFDRAQYRGDIIASLKPLEGEVVVEKLKPNAFSGTALADHLGSTATPVIIAGFMTHNCVASTTRAAFDLGYQVTVAADAGATRDLPSPDGGVIRAADLHTAELAALADAHAWVRTVTELLPPPQAGGSEVGATTLADVACSVRPTARIRGH